jgi:hypothetical protein
MGRIVAPQNENCTAKYRPVIPHGGSPRCTDAAKSVLYRCIGIIFRRTRYYFCSTYRAYRYSRGDLHATLHTHHSPWSSQQGLLPSRRR